MKNFVMLLFILSSSSIFAQEKERVKLDEIQKNLAEKDLIKEMKEYFGIDQAEILQAPKGITCDIKKGEFEEAIDYADQMWEKYRPIECKKSKSPLFSEDTEEPIDIEIIADWDVLEETTYYRHGRDKNGNMNQAGTRKYRPAVVTYKMPNGETQIIGGQISNRGGSRAAYCMDRKPFLLSFTDEEKTQEMITKIEANPGKKSTQMQLLEDLQTYPGIKEKQLQKGKQDNNLFDKVGDDVKVITHCGDGSRKDLVVGAKTPEEQDEKVIREYYAYKVQNPLKTMATTGKLARITYKDPSGKVLSGGPRYAVFREPAGALAKRCDMDHVLIQPNKTHSDANKFFELFSRFVGQFDHRDLIKNIDYLNDKDGKQWYTYYDYDGAPWVKYHTNEKDVDYSRLMNRFKEFLAEHNGDASMIVKAYHIVNQKEDVYKVINEDGPMKQGSKDHMKKWFDERYAILENYLASQTGDAKRLVEGLKARTQFKDMQKKAKKLVEKIEEKI